MALSIASKILAAFEATAGTIQPAMTKYMAFPINPYTLNEIIEPILDQTVRGNVSLDQDIYAGVRRVEGTLEGPLYPRECGMFLLPLMGASSSVAGGATSASKHTFYGATTNVPTLTLFATDDVRNYAYLGCNPTSFSVRYSAAEGIVTYSAGITGFQRTTAAAASAASAFPAFDNDPPFVGWRGYLSTGANASSALQGTLIDAEITVNRPLSLLYAYNCNSTAGSQVARRSDPGQIEVTGRITADYNTGSIMDLFHVYTPDGDLASSPLDITFHNGVGIVGSTGFRGLRIRCESVKYIDAPAEIDRSDTAMRISFSFRALHNASMSGPIVFETWTATGTSAYNSSQVW